MKRAILLSLTAVAIAMTVALFGRSAHQAYLQGETTAFA